MARINKDGMVQINLKIPKPLLEEVDELVKRGIAPSRSEAVRYLIRLGLMEERKIPLF